MIKTLLLHQRLVGAFLRHAAAIQYHDLVAAGYRAELVGNNEDSLILNEPPDGLLNLRFILRINAGSALIQQNDRGIFQKRPGDRKPLPFAAGEGLTVFADNGLVSVRETVNKFVTGCQLGGRRRPLPLWRPPVRF